MGWEDEKSTLRKKIFSKISYKLTLLFFIVGVVAPSIGICYFYFLTSTIIPKETIAENRFLLESSLIMIISVIAIDTAIIGFFISKSISKPIKILSNATKEMERGNLKIQTDISTGDEIEELSKAFNQASSTLAKLDQNRREIDKAKTEFISITSHELRSPMTPMKAQLQMLMNGYFGKLTNKQKKSLDIIVRNADRLDKIILDFLEISRIEAARLKFSFKKTDLVELAKEIVDFMDAFAKEKNISLKLKSTKTPIIEADPDRVSQVLRNLINNAIKFSKNNSEIKICIAPEDDHILFSVRDFGVGLSPEDQIRVFEPFYQTEDHSNRKHGGTGLGLAICRGIVESQKGKIWVESPGVGKGTIFYFTIPLKPVREIEPIKVLFSPRTIIEKKLKNEFQTMLGPLGISEFEELKNKNSLWEEDIMSYIDKLTNCYILNENQGDIFKNKIKKIFGDKKDIINDKPNIIKNDEVVKRG